MHDCPGCRVPLHGHEEVCPSCGERQYVKPEYRNLPTHKAPPLNILPFILVILVLGGVGIYAAQNSWIGQVLSHKTTPVDPLDAMTQMQARDAIETGITNGLTAVGATGKITYKVDGQTADKAVVAPVEMTIDTKLQSAEQHKAIIEPIKQFMEKARIPTLVMNDSKSHANWTYQVNLQAPAPAADDSLGLDKPASVGTGAPANAVLPTEQTGR